MNALSLSLKHIRPVNNSKNNTFKGNRDRVWHCSTVPAHQEVQHWQEMPPESQPFPACAIINAREDQRQAQLELLHSSAACAPCWTNTKPAPHQEILLPLKLLLER